MLLVLGQLDVLREDSGPSEYLQQYMQHCNGVHRLQLASSALCKVDTTTVRFPNRRRVAMLIAIYCFISLTTWSSAEPAYERKKEPPQWRPPPGATLDSEVPLVMPSMRPSTRKNLKVHSPDDIRYPHPGLGPDGLYPSPYPHPEGCRDDEVPYGTFCRSAHSRMLSTYYLMCGPPMTAWEVREWGSRYMRRIKGSCPLDHYCHKMDSANGPSEAKGRTVLAYGVDPQKRARIECLPTEFGWWRLCTEWQQRNAGTTAIASTSKRPRSDSPEDDVTSQRPRLEGSPGTASGSEEAATLPDEAQTPPAVQHEWPAPQCEALATWEVGSSSRTPLQADEPADWDLNAWIDELLEPEDPLDTDATTATGHSDFFAGGADPWSHGGGWRPVHD